MVRTPPASSGCLLGVTRALVLELCPTLGIAVEETPLPLARARRRRRRGVPHVDRPRGAGHRRDRGLGHTFADAPGPVTRVLAAAFDDLVASDLDP